MKWVILWLLLVVAILVGIGRLNLPLFYQLVKHGVRQQAVATRLTPEFHNTVCYEYQVDGMKFEGRDQSGGPNPPLGEIQVGQPLVIWYDPKHPSSSVLGNPAPMLTNELMFVGVAALAFPTVIVFRLRTACVKAASKASEKPGHL